jgi:hypothetical protein
MVCAGCGGGSTAGTAGGTAGGVADGIGRGAGPTGRPECAAARAVDTHCPAASPTASAEERDPRVGPSMLRHAL